MFFWRTASLLSLICMVLVLAPGCGGGSAGPTTSHVVGRVEHLKLTDKMTFDPPTITLKTNQPLTLIIQNQGSLKHNFTIDSLNIQQDVAPGAQAQITLTAPGKPGQIQYYCNVPGHREAGMVGTLVIEQ